MQHTIQKTQHNPGHLYDRDILVCAHLSIILMYVSPRVAGSSLFLLVQQFTADLFASVQFEFLDRGTQVQAWPVHFDFYIFDSKQFPVNILYRNAKVCPVLLTHRTSNTPTPPTHLYIPAHQKTTQTHPGYLYRFNYPYCSAHMISHTDISAVIFPKRLLNCRPQCSSETFLSS